MTEPSAWAMERARVIWTKLANGVALNDAERQILMAHALDAARNEALEECENAAIAEQQSAAKEMNACQRRGDRLASARELWRERCAQSILVAIRALRSKVEK